MHTAVTITVILFLLAVIDHALYLDITRLGWHRAKSALPEIAQKFNLTYEPAAQQHHMGTITGKYHGRSVCIDPDRRATIRIELTGLAHMQLNTLEPDRLNIPEGMTFFDSGNISFDRFFKSRLTAKPLQINPNFHAFNPDPFEQFSISWKSKLRYLKLGNNGLICSFKYGQASYIPAKLIERFLPELLVLTEAIESMTD
jgi:hypothetical protein